MKVSPYLILLVTLIVTACNTPEEATPPACDSGSILIAPTATRPTDPDIYVPPTLPDNGDGAVYCPTAVPDDIVSDTYPEQFTTAEITNLSLDSGNQELAATAVGDDMMAVAWINEGNIYVALARGGSHFQVRRVDNGNSVSLAFSSANRLHMAYERNGEIYYRVADQGTHPVDTPMMVVEDPMMPITNSRHPRVVVDELNWAHILYEQAGSIYKTKHLSNDVWLTKFVAYGTDPVVMPFYNEKETVLFGVPTGVAWLGILMAAPYNGEIRVFRYLSWFNIWEHLVSLPIPFGDELTGDIGLDYAVIDDGEAWMYATWVVKRPFPQPPFPLYSQPRFEAVNPLYPNQIGNPDQIYAGLNAVRWHTDKTPFDAGLKQTVSVANPNGIITLEAHGLADSSGDLTLRIGIDPTGSDNPKGSSVIWSAPAAPTAFSPFSLSVPAAGNTATLFLEGTMNTPDVPATAVYDAVTTINSSLTNGNFEALFIVQGSFTVPTGWTAYAEDSGNVPINGRDAYVVYAAWSSDGGASWSAPQLVSENRLDGGISGAIRPAVTPLISTATETPSVSFFTIYEKGNPPPDSDFIRFGRPYVTLCDLGTTTCTDAPGEPLLPRNVVRPTSHLLVTADPLNPDRALLVWDGLQTDNVSKDIYATYATVR